MAYSNVLSDCCITYLVSCNEGSWGRFTDTHFSWIQGSVIGETYASSAGHAGVPGFAYCLVETGISSGSIADLTKLAGSGNAKF